ncbi:MAG TPA: anti-sigma factor [Micropruina sp.]|nr:anti-sigma factor [Micropruina sp.]
MHPSDDVLAGVAIGDDTDEAVAAHLRTCNRCGATLDELRELIARVADAAAEQLHQPPDSVWSRIADETGEGGATEQGLQKGRRDEPDQSGASDAPLEAAGPTLEPAPPRFGRTWLWGAVAAGVAVGVLTATVVPQFTRPQEVVAKASLSTLDTGQTQGRATVTGQGTALDLNLQVQPQTAGTGFLEVWLINTDLKRMVSVGVLPNGSNAQEFPITSTLLEQGYVIVDISREPFDDRPQHSGDSLLRGTLS